MHEAAAGPFRVFTAGSAALHDSLFRIILLCVTLALLLYSLTERFHLIGQLL